MWARWQTVNRCPLPPHTHTAHRTPHTTSHSYGPDCSLRHCEGVKVINAEAAGDGADGGGITTGTFTNAMVTETMVLSGQSGTRIPCRFMVVAKAGEHITLTFPYTHIPGCVCGCARGCGTAVRGRVAVWLCCLARLLGDCCGVWLGSWR